MTTTTEDIVAKAAKWCEAHGYRFTKPRRHVLKIIAGHNEPVSAYDILDELQDYISNPKPPTVYRAIDFLDHHGFIHRIESRNAYLACNSDHFHAGSQFMICDNCGRTIEAHLCHLPEAINNTAQGHDFRVTHWDMEAHGICSHCQ